MKRDVYRFCLAACWYWLVETFAGQVLDVPEQIVTIAVFIPPVFGLMWGRPAALGVYVGGLLVLPDLQNLFFHADGISGRFLYLVRGLWIFLAAYLPYFLWQKWLVSSEENKFSLNVSTLQKFIAIMLVTFAATSMIRGLTATPADLEATAAALGVGKKATFFECMLVCFANDFCVAMFLDLAWFFLLVSRGYAFAGAADDAK